MSRTAEARQTRCPDRADTVFDGKVVAAREISRYTA